MNRADMQRDNNVEGRRTGGEPPPLSIKRERAARRTERPPDGRSEFFADDDPPILELGVLHHLGDKPLVFGVGEHRVQRPAETGAIREGYRRDNLSRIWAGEAAPGSHGNGTVPLCDRRDLPHPRPVIRAGVVLHAVDDDYCHFRPPLRWWAPFAGADAPYHK